MDTLQFFKAILPEPEGQMFYAFRLPFDKSQAGNHIACPDHDAHAKRVLALDANADAAVYHACAKYDKPVVKVPNTKKPGEMKSAWRVRENYASVKCFWVDIDCGAEKAAKGEGYLKKGEAAQAVSKFCADVGLKQPLTVDSGNGLHFYWVMSAPIALDAWESTAKVLKDCLAEHGVLQDVTRTADPLSILRPPGTHNRKDPANPKLIKVMLPGAVSEYADFDARVRAATTAKVSGSTIDSELVAGVLGAAPAWVLGKSVPNALAEHHAQVHFPSQAGLVADRCQQVRAMRDTQGDVSRDVWFGVIQIIRHCEGADDEAAGKVIARDWTAQRAATGHADDDWEKRYDTSNYGPTTCDRFLKINAAGCEGCKYRKDDGTPKQTSPIMLGRVMPEAPAVDAPVQTVIVQQDDEAITIDIPAMPAGFLWTGERLMRLLPGKDEDEPMQEITLAFDNFYIYNWARDDTNSFQALARLHQPRGGIVEWAFDMKALASPSDTLKELQGKSISLSTGKAVGEHVRAYLMACVHKVKAEADELRTAKSFGWRDDKQGFLISDRFHHVDGTLRKVLLGGNAHAKASMLALKRGTLHGYADAVDFVYNRPGMEPMQYAFCNAFGSILTPFSGELLYNGVLFAITGGRTAKGKTTVATAALYAFGDAAQMTHAKSTTLNARYGLMSTHGNLPILFDEFTDIEPKELSAWAYSTSEGREKGRMTVANGGVVMAEAGQWQLSPYVTANTDLRARLAQYRGNTQAESVRLVQIHIDKYPLPILNENEVSAALDSMADNMGHAGEAFVSYVVNNLPGVKAQMQMLADKVSKIIPGTAYRNYRAHMVCTLGAAQILCGLGIIKFDFEKMCKFAARLMRDMCVEVETVSVVDEQDQLVALINGLSPRIASTVGYGDTGIGVEEVRIYDGVAGRYIRGGSRTDPKYAGKLYLSIKEVGAWCIDNRSTPAEIVAAARAAGALVSEFEKFNLTSGTTVINAAVPCIVLDTLKLGGEEVLPPIVSVATGT